MQRLREQEDVAKQQCSDHDAVIFKLRIELADCKREKVIAANTIDELTRQVKALQVITARAEEAQRNAEADYILRHFVGNEEEKGTTLKQLQSELARVTGAKQQALNRVSDLEEELTWIRDAADTMSRELQDATDAKHDIEHKLQVVESGKREVDHELQQLKNATKNCQLLESNVTSVESVFKDDEQWNSMSSVCQKLVTTLRAQVKTLTEDKQKLDQAIICCQRSADNRFRALEQDRQKIQVENNQLRAETTRLRQDIKTMGLQLRTLEEDGSDETLAVEELTHLLHTQALQKELTSRIQEVEQKVVISADGEARNKKLIEERSELLKQLEEEHCHINELAHSNAIFKEATETALHQLKEVEFELRAINSSRDPNDTQHETVAELARLVLTGLKRHQDEIVDAAVASMQVYHLASSLEAHLEHLRALLNPNSNYVMKKPLQAQHGHLMAMAAANLARSVACQKAYCRLLTT